MDIISICIGFELGLLCMVIIQKDKPFIVMGTIALSICIIIKCLSIKG